MALQNIEHWPLPSSTHTWKHQIVHTRKFGLERIYGKKAKLWENKNTLHVTLNIHIFSKIVPCKNYLLLGKTTNFWKELVCSINKVFFLLLKYFCQLPSPNLWLWNASNLTFSNMSKRKAWFTKTWLPSWKVSWDLIYLA